MRPVQRNGYMDASKRLDFYKVKILPPIVRGKTIKRGAAIATSSCGDSKAASQ